MIKFENKGKWLKEAEDKLVFDSREKVDFNEEDELSGELLDEVESDEDFEEDELDQVEEEQINEVRYIDPSNVDKYDPNDIEEVTTASGEKRYKRKSGVQGGQTKQELKQSKDSKAQAGNKEQDKAQAKASSTTDIRKDKVLKRKEFFDRMKGTKDMPSAYARRYAVDRQLAHLIEEYPPEQVEEMLKNSSYKGENDYYIFKNAKEGAEHLGDEKFLKEKVDNVIENLEDKEHVNPDRFSGYIRDGIDALSSALPQDPQQFIQSLKPYAKDLGPNRLEALVEYKSREFRKELEKQLSVQNDNYWTDEKAIVKKMLSLT